MKKYDWKNEYNPIRRTAKRLLSGEALTDGRPLSDLIELDEQTARMKAIKQLYDSSAAFQSLKPVYDGLQKIKFEKPNGETIIKFRHT